ncbi:PQQ-dependent sugar dehydrogenase [Billgrantia sp. Q4P2]|uniref:PQQ-dependent sugar dehydrogenase n=1 Tax=Billgrantia sp. Q4P2 TaxID=3463857 RepID=UPI0040561C24
MAVDEDRGVSPSGLAVVNGEHYPQWEGNLLVGGLESGQLYRLEVTDSPAPFPAGLRCACRHHSFAWCSWQRGERCSSLLTIPRALSLLT